VLQVVRNLPDNFFITLTSPLVLGYSSEADSLSNFRGWACTLQILSSFWDCNNFESSAELNTLLSFWLFLFHPCGEKHVHFDCRVLQSHEIVCLSLFSNNKSTVCVFPNGIRLLSLLLSVLACGGCTFAEMDSGLVSLVGSWTGVLDTTTACRTSVGQVYLLCSSCVVTFVLGIIFLVQNGCSHYHIVSSIIICTRELITVGCRHYKEFRKQ